MRKLYVLSLLILAVALLSGSAMACSDIFINQSMGHIEARLMDFPVNIGNHTVFGFIGQQNKTDVVIDAVKISSEKLATWTNKYGYWGRGTFEASKVVEAMNTEGLSLSALYLAGNTKYPAYNSKDNRQVLGIYDLGSFLLGQCRDVEEALKLLENTQLVQSAIEYAPGIYIKDIPIHLSIRDAKGNSAVVEFVNGSVQIYKNAGNVMTNNPAYPDQLANAKRYNKILPERTKGELTGMPGSYSSPDRFARGYILTRSLPVPESHQEALYQAEMVIGTLIRPYFGVVGAGTNSSSIWMVVKDLDGKVIYEKNILYYQENKENKKTQNIITEDIENGYRKIDLKTMDWNKVPTEYANAITQPTPPEQVKRILTPDQIFGF